MRFGIATFALAALLVLPFAARADRVRVACVGDSITFGIGVPDRSRDSYPAQLARMLGSKYDVRNFGSSGATLLRDGNNPYWKTSAFRDATAFHPDIVVILLGTNDSKTTNWDGREEEFGPDCTALVAHFAKLTERPRIFIGQPPPARRHDGDIRERILVRERATLAVVAKAEGVALLDLDTPFRGHADWLADKIHPNEAGAAAMARIVAAAIRQ